ncbi:MAG: molybdopterin-synthase adenylyltransferase MoeB [Proteobacteria bacterium]|nr:molybdopterin-synthase adenylyltransferase MoeB [Pseudomonadota bacterium]
MHDAQLLRYSRHILLDEFGVEAQERLLASHALIVGAGGLGCPAALYLAASGVGRLTIADGDKVDATNLQRQILYRDAAVGRPKAGSAKAALGEVNPEVEVVALAARLEGAEMERLVAAADVVLDCTDNFATRHALNRACVKHSKPLVSGAAIRFDGQLAVFDLRRAGAPCYACLFPEDTAAEEVACAVMGVFSPLTGTIGALQAAEAIKLLARLGEPLNGRLQMFDALHAEWRAVRVPKDPACPVCGTKS